MLPLSVFVECINSPVFPGHQVLQSPFAASERSDRNTSTTSGAVKSNIKLVFGAMTIGKPGVEMTRVHTLEDTKAILDVFQKHGHREIDSSRVYGEGSSEEYLGEVGWQSRGLVMDTKLYPSAEISAPVPFAEVYEYSPADLRRGLMNSLKALKTDKVDLWYLHGADRSTLLEDTLRAVNSLHTEGYFNRLGISDYMSWEVAQICEICIKNGWIRPTVYQGLYNALHRAVEAELFSCLRFYGLPLYAFNPLAGDFFTGRYHRDKTEFEAGSRFDPNRAQGRLFHGRYWHTATFDALDLLRPVAKKHGLPEAECALRWIEHHSQLKRDLGDAVIVGASGTKQLEEDLHALDQGPLPDEVVEALDQGWALVRGVPLKFWH